MRYILRVIYEEYRAILKDAGVMLIFIAGLAIYTGFYPLPYSPEVLKEIPVVPVDQDHTALSRKLMRWLDATEEVHILEPSGDIGEATDRVLSGEARGTFVIPKGFEHDILRGKQAVVSIYADACYFLMYRQIATGAMKATATLSAGVEIRRYTAAGLGEKQAKKARDPLPVVSRALFNPSGGYATYVVPAVLILIMQQTLLIGIGMLGGTRNEDFTPPPPPPPGCSESPLAVLLGRGFVYFSIYMLYPLFYIFVIFRVYHLPSYGDIGSVMIFLMPYVLAVTYLGLTLNAVLRSRELSIPALMFTSTPAVFLMGFAWPFESLPTWLRNVAMLLPCTSACAGFVRLNQMGATLYDVTHEWFVLWALAGFYLMLAWLTTDRRPRPKPEVLPEPVKALELES